MKLLLDTHAFLQSISGTGLSDRAREAFGDLDNELSFSAASYWEICIKLSIGKLGLQPDWPDYFDRHMAANGIGWLPLAPAHCQRVVQLPWIHRDPFDRLLVAQAVDEGMAIVTADQHIQQYAVTTVW